MTRLQLRAELRDALFVIRRAAAALRVIHHVHGYLHDVRKLLDKGERIKSWGGNA